MISEKCNECSIEFDSIEFVFRHLRKHKLTAKEYVLKWKYNNVIPKCLCGCSQDNHWNVGMKDFTRFVHGHHAAGRVKSVEEKAKIGAKNSVNMKRFMAQHPEIAKKRLQSMTDARTPETYEKISTSIRKFWLTSPLADNLRKEASERAIKLLAENKIGPQAPFKRCTLKNPWTGEDEFMHSSWETAFFQACIDKRYEVTKNHGIEILYTAPDGLEHTYIPDFYGKEDRVLYEIKGRWDETDIAKWSAAEKFCGKMHWKFAVVFSPDDLT